VNPLSLDPRKDPQMKRTLLFTAALVAVLALPATASAFSGVAVAKDPARQAVVVASKGGVVRTVRAPGHLRALRPGQRIVYSARRLSDGTFMANTLRPRGRAGHAVLHGAIVRNQRRMHRLLISAGGSVLAVHAPARGFASDRGPRSGDRVEVRVRIARNGLDADKLIVLGHDNTLELEGIFLDVSGSTLRLAVEHRGEVFVAIPAGFRLPELRPGDEIELLVSVDAAGAFTLISVQVDDEDDDDQGIGEDNGSVEVHGVITDLPGATITVQSRDASPVTCAVPRGVNLVGFRVGDRVEMRCALVHGVLTLTRLRTDDDDDGGGHHGSG
jgi:hypothetical protein